VSVLVKLSPKYQKNDAMDVVNEIRQANSQEFTPRASIRVNARNAFPNIQVEMVKECYVLKRAGTIQAFLYLKHRWGGANH
jgi:hypothetical protein